MIRSVFILALLIVGCTSEIKTATLPESAIEEGDIIFQSTQSRQCEAVKLATHSEYSHVGIIFKENGEWLVYEAVQPVKKTPLADWISRGENGHYVIKRLKNAKQILTSEIIDQMKAIGEADMGKNYDSYFHWSNDEIYCSELVWKIYDEGANLQIGELRQLKDFDLSSAPVRTIMAERYGANIPLEGEVIAPSDLFDSEKFVLVDQR